MTAFHLRVTERGSVVVAALDGELDMFSSGDFAPEILSHVPNDALGLVVDLSGVRYVDSAGLRALFDIARRLEIVRQHLAVCIPPDSPLRRLVKVTNLEAVVLLCDTVDECLASFETTPRG